MCAIFGGCCARFHMIKSSLVSLHPCAQARCERPLPRRDKAPAAAAHRALQQHQRVGWTSLLAHNTAKLHSKLQVFPAACCHHAQQRATYAARTGGRPPTSYYSSR